MIRNELFLKLKNNYFILISTVLFLYFFFNLLDGERGLISYFEKKKILNDLEIKEGKLRLNWAPIHNASRSLCIGDRIQLEGRGTIEIISFDMTKRERWRVELLRK